MNTESIHLKMSVARLLDRWPEAIPVFLEHRMACVGCSMAKFETLEDAALIYGLNPKEFLSEIHNTMP